MPANKNIIIFDLEVTRYDWFLGWEYDDDDNYYFIHNDREAFLEFYENHKKCIWVGHNIIGYDLKVLNAIKHDIDPWRVSNLIIEKCENPSDPSEKTGVKIPYSLPVIPFDTFRQQLTHQPVLKSLKEIALLLGESLYGWEVDFNIDRPLTFAELESGKVYNRKDIKKSKHIFKYYKKGPLIAKIIYCNTFNLPLNDIEHHWSILAPKVMELTQKVDISSMQFTKPKQLDLGPLQYLIDSIPDEGYFNIAKVCKPFTFAGLEHQLGKGGNHSVIYSSSFKNVLFADVKAYYGNLQRIYGVQSRKIIDKGFIGKILDTRDELKQGGNVSQAAYKALLVIMYGITGDKKNPVYDPGAQIQIALLGQLFLLDLTNIVDKYFYPDEVQVIQTNTDGIAVSVSDHSLIDKVKEVMSEWEKRTGFVLEFDYWDIIYQKDTANYCCFRYDDDFKNERLTIKNTKVKGTYVNKYFNDEELNPNHLPFYDVNNRWLSIGLLRYLAFDKLDISDLDAKDLQNIVARVNGIELYFNDDKPIGKYARVYAAAEGCEYPVGQVNVLRKNKKTNELKLHKRSYEKVFVYNEDVTDMPNTFYNNIDYDWYYDEIEIWAEAFGKESL